MKIEITRGDTYSTVIEVVLTTIEGNKTIESAFDLTGYTALLTAKRNLSLTDENATIQKSLTVNVETSTIDFELDEDDTDFVGMLYFDVQIMNESTSQVKTILDGTITSKNDVTKTGLPTV